MASASGEIRALTGLRGGAAAYVCLYHLLYGRDSTGEIIQRALSKGYLAVDIFFVLSGLVMALTYCPMFAEGYRLANHVEFLLRRIARIVPLYYFLLGLTCVASAMDGHFRTFGTIFYNLLLVQTWGFGGPIVINPSWSISTEAAAYLLFPIFLSVTVFSSLFTAFVSFAVAIALLALSAASVGPAAMAAMNGSLDLSDGSTIAPLLRCFAGFLLGLLSFRLARSSAVRTIAGSDRFGVSVLLLLALGVSLRVSDFVLYPLFPALVLYLFVGSGAVARLAGAGPLHWLGAISYGVYLTHSLVIEVLWSRPQAWLAGRSNMARGVASATLCCVAILLLAQLLHIAIERPGRRLVRLTVWKLGVRLQNVDNGIPISRAP